MNKLKYNNMADDSPDKLVKNRHLKTDSLEEDVDPEFNQMGQGS